MKTRNFIALIMAFLLAGPAVPSFAQDSSVEPFLGMWALTLDYEDSNAGWLEVRQEDGYLDAELLWRGGNPYFVDYTMVDGDQLIIVHGRDIVKKRDAASNPVRTLHPITWYQMSKTGEDQLEGNAFFPNPDGIGVKEVQFWGKKLPLHGEAPSLKKIVYAAPITLFNGENLEGWELTNKKATNGWKVIDVVLANDPVQKQGEEHIHYGNLRTVDTFEDFNLKIEVNIPKGSNSGIYLRGIYEIQVFDSYGKELNFLNMGALYGRIIPLVAAEKPAGDWQKLDITLYKRYLTVVLNGKKIIDNQPVKGVTGGALTSDEFIPGPIYLQGDHGKVSYRNIVLTPILN